MSETTGTCCSRRCCIVKSFGKVAGAARGQLRGAPARGRRARRLHNGAGKSTLVKTLAGVHQADGVLCSARAGHFYTPLDCACALGIETVYQDLAVLAAELDPAAIPT